MTTPRVLELGDSIGCAYAGKLLIEHGATVAKVEPEAGCRWRDDPGMHAALCGGKHSIVAPDLDVWLAWADIVLLDETLVGGDFLPETLMERFPSLVALSVTPFGISGPYAGYAATELTLANAGGWAHLCPATHTDPDLPPLKVYGDHCQLIASVSAAAVALACYGDTLRSGVGEFIDFSIQSYVASVLEIAVPSTGYRDEVPARYHQRGLIPWRIFDAKDGPVFLACIEQDQWERLVEFMGNPEWATLEVFADQPSRKENQDMVHLHVQEFISEWQVDDLYHAAQAQRICVAPVLSLEALSDNEHLAAREFFFERDDLKLMSSAVISNQGRIRPDPPAALGDSGAERLLEDAPDARGSDTPARPLEGVRVLDLTWAWAGPFCSLNLAHLGAEVIRIETAKRADLYRRLPVYPPEMEEGLNRSGMFNQWNQGKASISVDLSTDAGIDLVKDLVAKSHVVVQNFATGVMERMGLGYETLAAINPALVMASISGYGQTGPYAEYMGYGPAIPPLTGLSAATGYPGGPAEEFGLSMPDPTAGITAAYAVVSALLRSRATGEGDHLDVSLWESTAALNVSGWMGYATRGLVPERMGNRSESMAPHGVYRCKGEDAWIAIACPDDSAWQSLAGLVDAELAFDRRLNDLEGRKRHEDEIDEHVAEYCADVDRWAATRTLQALGIPAFPTLTAADIIDDVHLEARSFIERLPHPEVGSRPHTGIPWLLSRRQNGVRSPAPCLDADTDRVLEHVLGLEAAAVAQLRDQGVIGV